MSIKISVLNESNVLAAAEGNDSATLVYKGEYSEGDYISLCCSEAGFYEVRLEDTLAPSLVYINAPVKFSLPLNPDAAACYSPRSFRGDMHLLTVTRADADKVGSRRNLALNPHDQHCTSGMYPHATANVETRNEAIFFARNAIDGIYANSEHFPYPFQSWGINRNPNAELKIDFGTPMDIDSIVLTLRADFPHDSYWTQVTVEFSDGSREIFKTLKTPERQIFSIPLKKQISFVVLKELIKAEDESPFPALTQIEAWGVPSK